MLTFADDTKIVYPVNSVNDKILLQNDLDSIISWSNNNNMVLNKGKFELLTHRQTKINPNLNLLHILPFNSLFNSYNTSKFSDISPSTHVRDLGITITSDLDWDLHINNICKSATKISFWILNIFYSREKTTMITLFNSLVRSKLEYCCQLWNPEKTKHIDAIERIFRGFSRKIDNMAQFDYWTRLKKLNLMSLQRRRERSIIILVWKIKNNLAPNDINLDFKTNIRNNKIDAVVKPMAKCLGKTRTSFENSFIIKSAKIWNRLPFPLREISNLNLFKKQLDIYLNYIPDEPPVQGYFHKCKNSILDYKTFDYNYATVSKSNKLDG